MKNHVIIVAGGSGLRMKSAIPKQFLCIGGIPILMKSITVFREFDESINIVVVLPKNLITEWQKLCEEYSFTEQLIIAEGGDSRFQSVKNGLEIIEKSESLIAVHDAARPLVTIDIIERVFTCAEKRGTAVPAIHPNDSIRIAVNNTFKAYDRNNVFLIQTPQCFQNNLLKKAYEQKYNERFTDDATVVETLGKKIYLIESDRKNIKITTPQDIIIAEAIIKSKIKH